MKQTYRALVYSKRDRTSAIFAELPNTNILVLCIGKDLNSLRKQKDSGYLQNLKAFYQRPDLELIHLHLILKYEDDLSQKTARSHP